MRLGPASVTIGTANGATRTCRVDDWLGSLGLPMSDGQIEAKFRALAEATFPKAEQDRLIELAWTLDGLADVNQFAERTELV